MKAIETVLAGYAGARAQLAKVPNPADNANPAVLAVRIELPGLFREVLEARLDPGAYKVSGSVGEFPLNMAAIPWVAAFRRDITTGARRGYYVVLLFSEDGASAVLSLNQGFHDFLREYKATATAERKARSVADFAASILKVPAGFSKGRIGLSATGGLGRGYQQGAILSKVYIDAAALTEDQFRADLIAALDAYDELFRIAGASLLTLLPAPTDEEFQAAVQEESNKAEPAPATKGPQPRPPKVPRQGQGAFGRDPKVAARALAAASYVCALAASSVEHQSFIAKSTKRNYVEAHHLVPMSRQEDFAHSLDVEENIVALCPNCHRQTHLGRPADKRSIIKRLLSAREAALSDRGINANLEQLSAFYEALGEDD